jgi:hypothetical protein
MSSAVDEKSLLQKADDAAIALARAYLKLGEVCVITRTTNSNLRRLAVIYPKTNIGVEVVATALHRASSILFDSEAT